MKEGSERELKETEEDLEGFLSWFGYFLFLECGVIVFPSFTKINQKYTLKREGVAYGLGKKRRCL